MIYVLPVSVSNISSLTPESFSIYQNYPNPFNPSTRIRFEIASGSDVRLSLYDVSGKSLGELFNGKLNAGVYEYEWNAGNLSSGVYFCRLEAAGFAKAIKMTLAK